MDLYQKVILDHYKNPRNFGELPGDCIAAERDNPVCGDQVKVMLRLDEQSGVGEIRFTARGCALSIASASMMAELVAGKSVSEVKEVTRHIIQTFREEKSPGQLDRYGEFSVLKGVFEYPVRIKCVLLCWHALEDALGQVRKS